MRGGRAAPLSRALALALGPRPGASPEPGAQARPLPPLAPTPTPGPNPDPLAPTPTRLDEMAVNYDDIESDRPALEDRLMGQYSAERQREIELEEEEYYDEYEPQSWSSWAFGYCSIL